MVLAARLITMAKAADGACERHRFWVLSIFSGVYFLLLGMIAARKPIWNDELFTLNIAKLPTMKDVWGALLTGAEQTPPFFYALMRFSISLFGEGNIALRLPAIFGFWVMGLCLFRFISKRSTVLYGLTCMLIPMTTGAFYYGSEARPYALVLGFSGIALVCWQSFADEEGGILPLIGFTLSLAAAIACHYYAVLILISFACGEAVRSLQRGRLAYALWAAMAASLAPLLISLPLIRAARSYAPAFWSSPAWKDVVWSYNFMVPAALPLTVVLLVAALYPIVFPESGAEDHGIPIRLLSHEVAAALGFLAMPAVAVTGAILFTGAFVIRYALPAVLGLGILLSSGFHRLMRGREILTILLVLCLSAGFVGRVVITLRQSAKAAQSQEDMIRMLQAEHAKDLPVVCSHARTFLELTHDAPPDVRSRLVYLADPEASLRYLGHNSIERGMLDLLKPWFGLNVQDYRTYLSSRRPFLLCGNPEGDLNWILQDLALSPGMHVELRDRYHQAFLFLVNYRAPERY